MAIKNVNQKLHAASSGEKSVLQLFAVKEASLTFCHHSAKVNVRCAGRGVIEATYSGVLTQAGFEALGAQVDQAAQDAVIVSRLDTALTLLTTDSKPGEHYQGDTAPGCFVVRPDQFEVAAAFAAELGRMGVIRAVFLASELELAQNWAHEMAA